MKTITEIPQTIRKEDLLYALERDLYPNTGLLSNGTFKSLIWRDDEAAWKVSQIEDNRYQVYKVNEGRDYAEASVLEIDYEGNYTHFDDNKEEFVEEVKERFEVEEMVQMDKIEESKSKKRLADIQCKKLNTLQ